MVSFKRKKISDNDTLGEILKKKREERKDSLEYVSEKINIQKEHLENLENSNYNLLPSEIYTKNFVRLYSQFLSLDPALLVGYYEKENNIHNKTKDKTKKSFKKFKPQITVTPKLFKKVIVGLIVVICLVYLGSGVKKIITPPVLVINTPQDNLVTDQLVIDIQGYTEKEVTVTINGQEILIDENGYFSDRLSLKPGLNLIKVSANKKYSKENTVLRQVLVEQKTANSDV